MMNDSSYSTEQMTVGQRCEVKPGGRRGEVAFIGKVEVSSSSCCFPIITLLLPGLQFSRYCIKK